MRTAAVSRRCGFCLRPGIAASVLVLFLAGAAGVLHPGTAWAEAIRIGGTGGSLGVMKELADGFMKAHPGASVAVRPSLGSSGGIRALLSGAIDVAVSSRPLKEQEVRQGAVQEELGKTPFVFAVSGLHPASRVSLREMVDIYAGKRTAWPDGRPIRLVLRPEAESDTWILRGMSPEMGQAAKEAMSRKGMIQAITDQDCADALENISGALGSTTLTQIIAEKRRIRPLRLDGVDPSLETVASGAYPFAKTIYLVTREKRSPLAGRFLEYLHSSAGRQILWQTGILAPESGTGK